MGMGCTVVLREVSKTYTYAKQRIFALSSIHLHLAAGDVFGLVGHAGSGKSTVLKCLNGLVQPDSGHIQVNDTAVEQLSPTALRRYRQQVGTFTATAPMMRHADTVANIALPLRFLRWRPARIRQRLEQLLHYAPMHDIAQHTGDRLSLWQRQQVALLRAIAYQPALLLCDCAQLAPSNYPAFVQLLHTIAQTEHMTIILASRSFTLAQMACNKIGILSRGRLVEHNDLAHILYAPQHTLTYDYVHWSNAVQSRCQ